jgi:hypothetical protein
MMNFAAHVTNIKNKAEETGFITLCIVKSKNRHFITKQKPENH